MRFAVENLLVVFLTLPEAGLRMFQFSVGVVVVLFMPVLTRRVGLPISPHFWNFSALDTWSLLGGEIIFLSGVGVGVILVLTPVSIRLCLII